MRAASGVDPRKIPAGMEVRFTGDSTNGTDPRPSDIALLLSADRTVHLLRTGSEWSSREEHTSWTTDTLVMHGVVHSNLYDAVNAGSGDLLSKGARAELAWTIADIFEYRIDMSRELQDGDAVRAVFERSRSPSGAVRIGAILAAGLERSGAELQAIRFVPLRRAARPSDPSATGSWCSPARAAATGTASTCAIRTGSSRATDT